MAKILIIDDDVNTTELMQKLFTKAGYEIEAINHGSCAVPKAIASHPDLIIVDLMMPDVDGIATCRALQAETQTQRIPILVFSAMGDIQQKIEAFKAGAKDFITKPVHIEELKSRINTWLEQNHNGNHHASS